MGKRNKGSSAFPVARIKKMMQADEEVGKIATSTPFLVGKALECLLEDVLTTAAHIARSKRSRTVSPAHLREAVESAEKFDFLREILSKAPRPDDGPPHKSVASASASANNTPSDPFDQMPMSLDFDVVAFQGHADNYPQPSGSATAASRSSSGKPPKSPAVQHPKRPRPPAKRPRAADHAPMMHDGAACEALATQIPPPTKRKSHRRSSPSSANDDAVDAFVTATAGPDEGSERGVLHAPSLHIPALDDAAHAWQTPTSLQSGTAHGMSTLARPYRLVDDDENYDEDDNEEGSTAGNATEDRSSFGWQPLLSGIKRTS